MSGPDFMVIGAEKAGTTWLYRNLKRHTALWLPPEKELHFFDDTPRDQWRREKVLSQARERDTGPKILDWFERFAEIDTSDISAYTALFEPKAGQKAGDMTTEYATLDDQTVEKISAAFPELRIVFVMREPAERLWSAYKMHMKQEKGEVSLDDTAKFRAYLSRRQPFLRTEYRRTLSIWRKWFGRAQVLEVFHDEIQIAPANVLDRVLAHLEVGHDCPHDPDLLSKKVFEGQKAPVPPVFAKLVAERYLPMLKLLAEEHGAPCDGWLERALASAKA
ncbi:MAG: sulfotransferase [Roseovarius sp.]